MLNDFKSYVLLTVRKVLLSMSIRFSEGKKCVFTESEWLCTNHYACFS